MYILFSMHHEKGQSERKCTSFKNGFHFSGIAQSAVHGSSRIVHKYATHKQRRGKLRQLSSAVENDKSTVEPFNQLAAGVAA